MEILKSFYFILDIFYDIDRVSLNSLLNAKNIRDECLESEMRPNISIVANLDVSGNAHENCNIPRE